MSTQQIIKVTKNQKININKDLNGGNPLKHLLVGLGWEAPTGGQTFDLDASVLAIGDNKTLAYFGELSILNGSIKHQGDNLTGEGEGDDEQIKVNLETLPSDVTKLVVYVNIYQAKAKGNQNFGQVSDAFVRLENVETGSELGKFELDFDMSSSDGMIFCTLVKRDTGWFVVFDQKEFECDNLSDFVSKF